MGGVLDLGFAVQVWGPPRTLNPQPQTLKPKPQTFWLEGWICRQQLFDCCRRQRLRLFSARLSRFPSRCCIKTHRRWNGTFALLYAMSLRWMLCFSLFFSRASRFTELFDVNNEIVECKRLNKFVCGFTSGRRSSHQYFQIAVWNVARTRLGCSFSLFLVSSSRFTQRFYNKA